MEIKEVIEVFSENIVPLLWNWHAFLRFTGVMVSFFPPPVFPRGRIRPAHFFPGEETD